MYELFFFNEQEANKRWPIKTWTDTVEKILNPCGPAMHGLSRWKGGLCYFQNWHRSG